MTMYGFESELAVAELEQATVPFGPPNPSPDGVIDTPVVEVETDPYARECQRAHELITNALRQPIDSDWGNVRFRFNTTKFKVGGDGTALLHPLISDAARVVISAAPNATDMSAVNHNVMEKDKLWAYKLATKLRDDFCHGSAPGADGRPVKRSELMDPDILIDEFEEMLLAQPDHPITKVVDTLHKMFPMLNEADLSDLRRNLIRCLQSSCIRRIYGSLVR